ncbi:MAG: hypothetical protein KC657_15280 [Myxococcales bacterium]|nr:hypothetical protein [Myxococcales bacterium]
MTHSSSLRLSALASVAALCLASAACTSKSDSPAPAPGAADGAAPTQEAGGGGALQACGVFKPGGACGDCKVTQCCDQGKACEADAECKVCAVGTPPDAVKCLENKLFSDGITCVETKCEKECPGG